MKQVTYFHWCLWVIMLLFTGFYALETVKFSDLEQAEQQKVLEYYENQNGTRHETGVSLQGLYLSYDDQNPMLMVGTKVFHTENDETESFDEYERHRIQDIISEIKNMELGFQINSQNKDGAKFAVNVKTAKIIYQVKEIESIKQKKIQDLNEKIQQFKKSTIQITETYIKEIKECISILLSLEEKLKSKNEKDDIDSFIDSFFGNLKNRNFSKISEKTCVQLELDYQDEKVNNHSISKAIKYHPELKDDYSSVYSEDNLKKMSAELKNTLEKKKYTDQEGNFSPELLKKDISNDFFNSSGVKDQLQQLKSDFDKNVSPIQSQIEDIKKINFFANLILFETDSFNFFNNYHNKFYPDFLGSMSLFKPRIEFYKNYVEIWKMLEKQGYRQCDLNPKKLIYSLQKPDAQSDQSGNQNPKYIPLFGSFENLSVPTSMCQFKNSNSEFFPLEEHFPSVKISKKESERFSVYSIALGLLDIENSIIHEEIDKVFRSESKIPEDLEFKNMVGQLRNFELSPDSSLNRIFGLIEHRNRTFNQEIAQKIKQEHYNEFSSIQSYKKIIIFGVNLYFLKLKSICGQIYKQMGVPKETKMQYVESMDAFEDIIMGMINGEFGYDEVISQFDSLIQSAPVIQANKRDRVLEQDFRKLRAKKLLAV